MEPDLAKIGHLADSAGWDKAQREGESPGIGFGEAHRKEHDFLAKRERCSLKESNQVRLTNQN